jgi:hypothetical protein
MLSSNDGIVKSPTSALCCILDDKWFVSLPRFPIYPFLAIDWFYNGLTGITGQPGSTLFGSLQAGNQFVRIGRFN